MTRYRVFPGGPAPLAFLSGAALLILATDRLAHAVIAAGALVWVYCLSALVIYAGAKIFPRRNVSFLVPFLASFMAALFLLLLWLLSPICALETFFVIALTPLFCLETRIFGRLKTTGLGDSVLNALCEALFPSALLVIFSIIREPLGCLSLSLPGGAQGIILLFSFEKESVLPIRIIAGSSGALLLLGYSLALYRYFRREKHGR